MHFIVCVILTQTSFLEKPVLKRFELWTKPSAHQNNDYIVCARTLREEMAGRIMCVSANMPAATRARERTHRADAAQTHGRSSLCIFPPWFCLLHRVRPLLSLRHILASCFLSSPIFPTVPFLRRFPLSSQASLSTFLLPVHSHARLDTYFPKF